MRSIDKINQDIREVGNELALLRATNRDAHREYLDAMERHQGTDAAVRLKSMALDALQFELVDAIGRQSSAKRDAIDEP